MDLADARLWCGPLIEIGRAGRVPIFVRGGDVQLSDDSLGKIVSATASAWPGCVRVDLVDSAPPWRWDRRWAWSRLRHRFRRIGARVNASLHVPRPDSDRDVLVLAIVDPDTTLPPWGESVATLPS